MVDPISNQQFSHDYQKFVFQDLSAIPVSPYGTPKTPFELFSVKKTKKDLKKEDSSPHFKLKEKKDESKDEESEEKKEPEDKNKIDEKPS